MKKSGTAYANEFVAWFEGKENDFEQPTSSLTPSRTLHGRILPRMCFNSLPIQSANKKENIEIETVHTASIIVTCRLSLFCLLAHQKIKNI